VCVVQIVFFLENNRDTKKMTKFARKKEINQKFISHRYSRKSKFNRTKIFFYFNYIILNFKDEGEYIGLLRRLRYHFGRGVWFIFRMVAAS
jgi:hypothetical protein